MLNKELRELHAISKEVLKKMADTQGYNYNKPMTTLTINGNTTIRKIEQAIAPHTPENSTIMVFFTNKEYTPDQWRGLTRAGLLTGQLTYTVDDSILYPTRHIWTGRKGEAENVRKSKYCQTIVVAQYKEHLNAPKVHYSYRWYWDKDKTTPDTPYINRYYELKAQAKATREAKQKAEFLATDTTAKVEAVTVAINNLKKLISDRLLSADTYQEMKIVYKMVDDFSNGLMWTMADVERFIKRTQANDYPSVEAFEKAYNEIMTKCETCAGF